MAMALTQPQFSPVPVEQHVIAIFAGSGGFLDDIPVPDVRRFESELLAHMSDKYPEVAEGIRLTGAMNDDMQNTLKRAVADFKAAVKPSA